MKTTTETKSLNYIVKQSLNAVIGSIQDVIPNDVVIGDPSLVSESFYQREQGVLIGITGDLRGQFLIEGEGGTFSSIAQTMFGAELEGEMLESFVGELGNMISGNMVTKLSEKDIHLDISPPTVIVGKSKYTVFTRGIHLPVEIRQKGNLMIMMMIKEEDV